MSKISFRNIDNICQQLAGWNGNGAVVDKIVGDGIRQRVIDRASLPLVIQKLSSSTGARGGGGGGGWALALRTLESEQLDRHRVTRDPNIWRIIDAGLPANDPACKDLVDRKLRGIFNKKPPSGGGGGGDGRGKQSIS